MQVSIIDTWHIVAFQHASLITPLRLMKPEIPVLDNLVEIGWPAAGGHFLRVEHVGEALQGKINSR
jgi:hypothetical protein